MNDLNEVQIVGTLMQNSPLTQTRTGVAACNLKVATQRERVSDRPDATREDWHHICCYGQIAERAATIPAGTRVRVVGTLQNRITQLPPQRRLTAIYAKRVEVVALGHGQPIEPLW